MTNDIFNAYTTIDIYPAMARYYQVIPEVLAALSTRAIEMGIVEREAMAIDAVASKPRPD